jgi:hypothetical protein
MKTARLHGIIRGTLEVKQMYWPRGLDLRSRARVWGERCLLWLPPPLVLWLFLRTQYCRRLPRPPRREETHA